MTPSQGELALPARDPFRSTDGEDAPAREPERLQIRSPANGLLMAEVPVSTPAEVREAVHRAAQAAEVWGALPVRERVRRLRQLHRVIGRRSAEISDRIQAETGKPEGEALSEVIVSLDHLRYLCRIAPSILRRRRAPTGWLFWKRAWTEPVPMGVVGILSPWNFPWTLTADPAVTALAAGNAVVIKPSEVTPLSVLLLPDLAREAGLPDGLISVVPGGVETGRELIAAGIDHLVFIGGLEGGRRVMEAAARHPIPVTLELGGIDPAIVLEDADLERTARGLVFGAFFGAGQACISVERVYVVEELHDRLVRRVSELARALRPGSGGGIDVGPMVTESQLRKVEEHITDALNRGARLVTGGGRTDPASNVLLPTVLTRVDESMRVLREESFGPILPIVRVRDADEAVERANATGFSLFASVWTRDERVGVELARRLRAGGVSVNDVISHWSIPSLPVGGVGPSGFGRMRGEEGLRTLSQQKSYLLDRAGLRKEPWWFPYNEVHRRLLRATVVWRGVPGPRGIGRAIWRLVAGGEG